MSKKSKHEIRILQLIEDEKHSLESLKTKAKLLKTSQMHEMNRLESLVSNSGTAIDILETALIIPEENKDVGE